MIFKLLFRRQCCCFSSTASKVIKRSLCDGIPSQNSDSNYKYLLILDLEATCDNVKPKSKSSFQEIIEFPCVKINLDTYLEEGRFHHYVRPVFLPTLSNFCVELTGILQEMVDEAKTFPEVYNLFENWRTEEGLTEENSLYITSGDWDLGHMIPEQCALSNIEVPSHMKIWTDIKKLFGYNNNIFYHSFTDIMKHYKLEFQGRKHSGIDDCLNILQVIQVMGKSGIKFKPTTKLSDQKVVTFDSSIQEVKKNFSGPSVIVGEKFKKKR